MMIVMKAAATEEQIQAVIDRIEAVGARAHPSRGDEVTVIGAIGDREHVARLGLEGHDGVEQVVPILKPYKLASREFHPADSVIEVRGVRIGGGHLAMIAGPCSVEEPERMDLIAGEVKKAGANIFRGGAFKPRTSPYAFQGLGEAGLKLLREVGDRHGLPVVTEVTDPRCVEIVAQYAHMIQIGARNMQNFVLLTEVGRTNIPVLLKRGMSATVNDLLMSAEYILSQGNSQVVLCERGVKGFDSATRNLYDVASVAVVKGLSHLPIIVDPSHATGRPDLIPPCALAGVAVGADGVHIEVHDCPELAKSDGPQALLPRQYAELVQQIRKVAEIFGKTISPSPTPSKKMQPA